MTSCRQVEHCCIYQCYRRSGKVTVITMEPICGVLWVVICPTNRTVFKGALISMALSSFAHHDALKLISGRKKKMGEFHRMSGRGQTSSRQDQGNGCHVRQSSFAASAARQISWDKFYNIFVAESWPLRSGNNEPTPYHSQ